MASIPMLISAIKNLKNKEPKKEKNLVANHTIRKQRRPIIKIPTPPLTNINVRKKVLKPILFQ